MFPSNTFSAVATVGLYTSEFFYIFRLNKTHNKLYFMVIFPSKKEINMPLISAILHAKHVYYVYMWIFECSLEGEHNTYI